MSRRPTNLRAVRWVPHRHRRWPRKLPKFSTLTGDAAATKDDWCEEHGVPETQCVECQPDLLPRGQDYGWCKAHGVHNCPLEHPDVAQLKKPPLVTDADRERAARALAALSRPDNNAVCKNYLRRIQFASLQQIGKAGVDISLVDRHPSSSVPPLPMPTFNVASAMSPAPQTSRT